MTNINIKERTEQLIDNNFIDEFLKHDFTSDEKYFGVKYMLYSSDLSPIDLLKQIKGLPIELENNLSLKDGFQRLLVDLILTDYSLREDVIHIRQLRRID